AIKLRILILISFLCFGFVNGQNYNVLNFGAKGDGQTDDSKAFVEAWNATCGGEGDMKTLLIPTDKTLLLQPVAFEGPCTSTSIKIQLDGDIVAPSNQKAWSNSQFEMWISFTTVSGLIVVGSGKINGCGSSFWEQKVSQRPTALHFTKCDNLRISGITSIDSPKNHISIKACENVAISNINLLAPEESPNTDGIDISDSTNVNIFESTIQTGDDCIAINTGNTNINITRINCGPGHGIKTTNGARIKTFPGGQGYARNISFEDITLINAKNPIIIDQHYVNTQRLDAAEDSAVAISSIKFIGFRGTTPNENAITLDCSATTRCKDVVMDGINITMADGEKPKVECKNVDGKSEDTILMRDCFQNA
ncbi:hypothetical protein EUTSA_v10027457mg, partial [Eutrema salsugineum]